MPEFLTLLPPAEALARLLAHWRAPAPVGETINTSEALGRVTAQAVSAPEDLPAFARATMDGYALRARDTFGASEALPMYVRLVGETPMGGAPDFTVGEGQAGVIHTGGMLPRGADAVVMLEYTQSARTGVVEVLRAVAPGENVLPRGTDARAGQTVLPAGRVLRAAEIGGLMALGLTRVRVARKPRVGILSSGDEVIDPAAAPRLGQVRDVNSYTLAALVEQSGGQAVRLGIVPDRAEELTAALQAALSTCDLVVVTAGSSASARDLTAAALNRLGRPGVLVHGVNVKPGKPTILALCAAPEADVDAPAVPVVGLPGNPVSALVIARLFVVPLIAALLGQSTVVRPRVRARLTVNVPSQAGREDWLPVRLLPDGAGWLAEPIFYQSNLILTLAQADGLLRIPADAVGLEAGAEAEVDLLGDS